MTIGVVLLTLAPGRVGGAESYIRALLDGLATRGEPSVHVLANRAVTTAYQPLARGSVELRELPYHLKNNRMLAAIDRMLPRRLPRQVSACLDVIHYPLPIMTPRSDLPTVVTLHDVLHHDFGELFSFGERLYRRVTYDRAAQAATRVVTVSAFARDRIVKHLGLDGERVVAIPHGIDHKRFQPMVEAGDATVRKSYGLRRRFLFYPANLWPHKNHRRLLEAFSRVKDPAVDLVLTGQTYGRLAPLQGLAASLGIRDRVRHLGHVPEAHIPPLYREAEALVFPSLYEGFGAPPLEAMACGCPVASSMCGGLEENARPAALPLSPEDSDEMCGKIEQMLQDDGLRARLRDAGLRHAAGYRWGQAVERHAEVYHQAVQIGISGH